MAIDPIQLARTLIDIPSTTGDENGVSRLLDTTLGDLGFVCSRQEISEDRFNLLAVCGTPRLLLCSHTDTVPPFIGSSEDDAYLYGRGACDTKGIIAAMIAASERLMHRGVCDFGLLFVVGEETDSIGAKRANDAFGDLGCEFIVVGEPTESRFVRASKGALTCLVRFRGVAAHSAYPEKGDSAIRKLMKAIEAIETTDWGSDPVLGSATVNIGVVRGGQRANIVPDSAEAEMIFRHVTTPGDILERLGALVAKFDGGIRYHHGNDPVFMWVPRDESSVVVAFNTDVPHLRRFGRALLWGPGSILDAHTATEKIAKKELQDAIDMYEQLVCSLLEGKDLVTDGSAA